MGGEGVDFLFFNHSVLRSNPVPGTTPGTCRPSENIHSVKEYETNLLILPRAYLFDHGFGSTGENESLVPKAQAPSRATQKMQGSSRPLPAYCPDEETETPRGNGLARA